MTAFEHELQRLEGGPLPLSGFAGRPMLIVNTASRCGFTGQYAGLQALHREYAGRGLVVLGVPSNDFGAQEPGEAAEIAGFCQRNYGVEFAMAAKVPVRGPTAHPLFRYLAEQGGLLARPRWNFYKYVVGRDGRLAAWFGSVTTPGSRRVRAAIESALRT